MIQRVLIGVDGSDCARRAAKYGFEIARNYDAVAEVVHVHSSGHEEEGRQILKDATQIVSEFGMEDDVEIQAYLLEGSPAKTVLRQTKKNGIDLIVMGRQGRTGLEERLLGSITERVLRRTSLPVLTVPEGELTETTGANYDNLLLPVDPGRSEGVGKASSYAADIAESYRATLHLLSVVDVESEAGVFDAGGVSSEYIERIEKRGHDAVDSIEEDIRDYNSLSIIKNVVRGDSHSAISDYAEDRRVDLIVMPSKYESSYIGQRIGSITGRVLRISGVPVLVIR
ncbi:MAG: universal stress protein [Halobacteria archaeon]|nr:universal stress protein [Halobacteria archaeon]